MKNSATALLVIVIIAVLAITVPRREYGRVTSPDGTYVAIAEYRACRAWLPLGPRNNGAKPGWIRVVTRGDALVGEVSVPMVSLVYEIRWSADEAAIPEIATWKLTE